MLKINFLTEIVINKIKKSSLEEARIQLSEELGIADEVVSIASHVTSELQTVVRNTPSKPFNIDGVTYKKASFIKEIYGLKVMVVWEYYDIFKPLKQPLNKKNEFNWDSGDKILNVTIVSSFGRVNWIEILEGVQHECSHMFETENRGKPYKSDKLYKHAINRMNSKTEDHYRVPAYIYYVSKKYEQTAFENGAYAYMMQYGDYHMDFMGSLERTKLFQWYCGMRQCEEYLIANKNYNPDLNNEMANYNGMKYEDFLNLCQNNIKGLIRKIGRVVAKAMKDYEEKHKIVKQVEPPKLDMFNKGQKEMREMKYINLNKKFGLID